MSRRRPLTLTIANGSAITAQPAQIPSNRNAAAIAPVNPQKLAQIIDAYAGLLGVQSTRSDIEETMAQAAPDGDNAPQALIETGLRSLGCLVKSVDVSAQGGVHGSDHWPALAMMTNGQIILVLEQLQDEMIVYDTTCADNRAAVPLAEFAPFFTGEILSAEVSLHKLSQRHQIDTEPAHWFWGAFRPFRRQLGEIALGSLVANLLAVAVALFSLQVYDRVIPHQSEATLWVLAIGALVALTLEGGLKIARAHLMDGAGRQIELGVQELLMRRIMGMRSDVAGQAPSTTFSAMREFSAVREFFTASTVGSLADLPFVFLFLLLVWSIAGGVVWVLILGGILMVVPGFILQKRLLALTEEAQGASAKSTRLLHEVIFERDTLKTQRGEARAQRIWQELITLSALKSGEQRRLTSMLNYWSQGVQQATYVVAVIVGTYLVFAGAFTVGSIIAVGILTGRTLGPLTQLAGILARWGNVKAALDGLDAVAQAAQDTDATRGYLRAADPCGHFELRDVTFRYDADGGPVLDVAGLAILPGQRLAILGANGSGKSSLLKVLSGLYAPSTGRVLMDGTDMTQIAPRDLRRHIGYLGQDVRLFCGTLRDNVNLTLMERDDARLMAALDFAGLGAFVRSHHRGLDLEILDGGAGLSIGQRQSIGWARLWLQDPKICLLDEPTAALDQALETALVTRLQSWCAGRTVVIATHRAPILALVKRTLVLQGGRLLVDGPRDAVMRHLDQTAAPLRAVT